MHACFMNDDFPEVFVSDERDDNDAWNLTTS